MSKFINHCWSIVEVPVSEVVRQAHTAFSPMGGQSTSSLKPLKEVNQALICFVLIDKKENEFVLGTK